MNYCDAQRAKGLSTFALRIYQYENLHTVSCPGATRRGVAPTPRISGVGGNPHSFMSKYLRIGPLHILPTLPRISPARSGKTPAGSKKGPGTGCRCTRSPRSRTGSRAPQHRGAREISLPGTMPRPPQVPVQEVLCACGHGATARPGQGRGRSN